MKVIISAALILLFFFEMNAQTRPKKKLEIVPKEEFKFFNGDSLKDFPDSMIVRIQPRDSKMPEYKANPDVDYKMKISKADSTIDYKILKKRY